MSNSLPSQKKLISISQTAKFLGVSIDTVRRWDKSGVLQSERPDGKNRYFSLSDLEEHRSNQPLTISETAKKLNVSATTLRRLEARGILVPNRNNAGERVYDKKTLEKFLQSDYFRRKTHTGIDFSTDSNAPEKAKKIPQDPSKLTPNEQSGIGFFGSKAKDYPEEFEKPYTSINLYTRLNRLVRIPELFAVFVIFFLLVAIGATNITAAKSKYLQQSPASAVLSTTATYTPESSPSVLFLDQNTSTPCCTDEWLNDNFPTGTGPALPDNVSVNQSPATVSVEPDDKLNLEPADSSGKAPIGAVTVKIITVKISGKDAYVNIHQFPTTQSEPLARAHDGDTFKLVALDSGWYMVKISNGSYGFIDAEFAQEGEEES